MLDGIRRKSVAFVVRSALVLGSGLMAVAAASSAHGQSPDPGDLLGGGIGRIISDLTCDPSRNLAGPLGPLGGGVSALLCNVGQLQFTIHTVYQRPDGSTVTRDTGAVLLVPTLLNVDDDLLPDLQASLTPMSTSRLVLRIDRALLETSPLPVSVEVIANDPSGGSLPRQRIAFGYDARGSRAPQSFEADIRIGESATEPGAATLGIQYATSGTGPSLAVTGGVFDGTAANRTNPVGVRQSYTPMPSRTGLELVIGHRLAMRQTTNAPAVLAADFEDVAGPDEVRAHAVIDRLPAFVETVYDPIAVDHRKITYSAAAAVGRFILDYTDKSGAAVNQAATVMASALPTGLALEQTAHTAGTFEATGGTLGSVEVGYAEGGMPRLIAGATGPYGYVAEDAALRSYAGRIDGLQRASFDAGGPIVVDTQIAARKPFTIKVDQPGLAVDGSLIDLPRHARVAIDLAGGKLGYDGFGDTIDQVAVDARQAAPFFGPVRRIQATVRQLPPLVTAAMLAQPVVDGQPRKGIDLQASAPVGSIDVLLRSDPDGPVPTGVRPGRQGASVLDTASAFSALARVSGLKSLRYLAFRDGTATVPEVPYELRMEHAAGPFDVRYGQDGSTINGEIEDVPAVAHLTYAKSAGVLHYDGAAGIGRIFLQRQDSQPFADSVKLLRTTITGVPQPIDVTLRSNPVVGGHTRKGIDAHASAPLGSIEVLLQSDPAAPVPTGLRPDRQGASVLDTAAAFSGLARVTGLTSLRYLAPSDATATVPEMPYELGIEHAAGPFDVRYGQDGSTINGEIEDVPAVAHLTYTKAAGVLHYDGAAGIERVFLQRQDDQPFAGAAKLLRMTIHGVPQPVDITLPRKGVPKTVVTATSPLRQVELLLTSGADPSPGGDPNDTGESRLFVRSSDACCPVQLELAARVNGFKGLSFADNVLGAGDLGTEVSLDLAAAQRFKAHAEVNRAGDAVAATGVVDLDVNSLPTHFDARLSENTFRWFSSAKVDSIKLTAANLPGSKGAGAPHFLDTTLTKVPSSYRVGLSPSDTGFASDNDPIGEAEVNISDVQTTFPDRLPADRNTVRLVNADAGLSQARVRIFDVKRATAASIGDNLSGNLEFGAAPRKPFDVLLDRAVSVPLGTARQHTEIHVPQPPQRVDVDATAGDKVTRLSYDAHGQGFPEFDLRATSRKPDTSQVAVDLTGIDVVVKDLPARLTFCFTDQGQLAGVQCRHDAPDQYVVDPCITCQRRLITQYNDATVSLETPGATSRVRLERLYSCHGPDPAFGDSCLNAGDRFDFLSIRNLLARRFQFEYADSESVEREDGDPVEDDLLKLYLDTGEDGINIERLEAWKHDREKRTIVIANDLGDPVRADHAFAAIDTTPPPSLEASSGSLHCDHIDIRTQVPILGTIDVEPLLPICD